MLFKWLLTDFEQFKNLVVIFAGFKQVKNLLVIFLTLSKSKAPFGETPWLTEDHATPLVTSLFGVTMLLGMPWRMPCHACGHLVIYRESYGLRERFLLSSVLNLLVSKLPWGWQFNLKVSKDSCWSLKHSPGAAICLNHSNPQKSNNDRFYLCV